VPAPAQVVAQQVESTSEHKARAAEEGDVLLPIDSIEELTLEVGARRRSLSKSPYFDVSQQLNLDGLEAPDMLAAAAQASPMGADGADTFAPSPTFKLVPLRRSASIAAIEEQKATEQLRLQKLGSYDETDKKEASSSSSGGIASLGPRPTKVQGRKSGVSDMDQQLVSPQAGRKSSTGSAYGGDGGESSSAYGSPPKAFASPKTPARKSGGTFLGGSSSLSPSSASAAAGDRRPTMRASAALHTAGSSSIRSHRPGATSDSTQQGYIDK